jgi:hypothetical protein
MLNPAKPVPGSLFTFTRSDQKQTTRPTAAGCQMRRQAEKGKRMKEWSQASQGKVCPFLHKLFCPLVTQRGAAARWAARAETKRTRAEPAKRYKPEISGLYRDAMTLVFRNLPVPGTDRIIAGGGELSCLFVTPAQRWFRTECRCRGPSCQFSLGRT